MYFLWHKFRKLAAKDPTILKDMAKKEFNRVDSALSGEVRFGEIVNVVYNISHP